jgi:F-type H+-transporting ATPase subunit gamma
MANLKDIRTRIQSVKTTRQVTSAMKMVSAARLKKAQDDISHIRPYTSRLASIIVNLKNSLKDKMEIRFSQPGKGKNILILAVASNRGLCGGFNANVVKVVQNMLSSDFANEYKSGQVLIGVLGKQVQKMFRVRGIHVNYEYNELIHAPSFSKVSVLANNLMADFEKGELKQVIIVYNEFVNAAVQEVKQYQYLPFSVPDYKSESGSINDYILEPDAESIVQTLVPKMLQTMLFQVMLESLASEHGARMTSMHKATDNASDLIHELQLSYNKARQSAITNEILEITGGAEALKGG